MTEEQTAAAQAEAKRIIHIEVERQQRVSHIAPLADRMRAAADTIEQWNAMCGTSLNHFVTPNYLRAEADKL